LPAAGPNIDDPDVISLHRYLGATYHASRRGPIESICYEEDAFVLQGFGQGQKSGLALWQAGRVYAAAVGVTGVPSNWRHLGPRVFRRDDFYELLPGAVRDPSSKPDFSADGSPIDLGLLRANTSRTSGYIMVGAIDNWAAEINCGEGITPPPTHSPTPTPTPTPTVTSVATPTPTATLTPFVYPTPPSTPSPLYLPLILSERCPPSDLFADIALVIDASTTMGEHSRSGKPKIDLAVAATRSLLTGLRLHRGGDRISLISFNSDAVTHSPLTDDRNALELALSRIVIREQSRIDLGLLAGAQSLSAARPEAMRALVLLSDGHANSAPATDVLEAAASVHTSGITLYVVGIGPSMDRALLREIAADPTRLFASVDPDLLGEIYGELARRVPCPPGVYWGRR
jgi:hypothetical protein